MNTTVLIRVALFAAILFLIDLYAFQAIKTTFRDSSIARWVYWGSSIGMYIYLVVVVLAFQSGQGGPTNKLFSNFMGLSITLLVPKLLVLLIMLGEDIWRVIYGTFQSLTSNTDGDFLAGRRKFISQTALVLAAIPFAGILHGIWKGKYNFRVIKKTLWFEDLPKAFDGFTLTQISDVHSGSFDNAQKIQYGIDLINQQQSDVILFTGDIVNNKAKEMKPWESTFSQLKAPMGQYSILGNHDYGDYVQWPSPEAKAQNMQDLYQVHERIGFKLLRNENLKLEKDGESIDLIGVENWGKGFAQHGDLDNAAKGLDDQSFKILMSHDPSHFDEVVKKFGKFIHLTLSGHTHGMQFGIEIPGFIKWSPVKFRYPKWAGLYEEMGRYLYVNRGFGFLAFPGRVGIWPEITVLELKRK